MVKNSFEFENKMFFNKTILILFGWMMFFFFFNFRDII